LPAQFNGNDLSIGRSGIPAAGARSHSPIRLEVRVNYFIIEVSEEEIKREREKARELRKSQWWKNRLAKGLCHWCREPFFPSELSMDHIVPHLSADQFPSSPGRVVR